MPVEKELSLCSEERLASGTLNGVVSICEGHKVPSRIGTQAVQIMGASRSARRIRLGPRGSLELTVALTARGSPGREFKPHERRVAM